MSINQIHGVLTTLGARGPDKVRNFIVIMPTSSPFAMFDHLLELSYRDDSNKWSDIGFGEGVTQLESIEVNFTHLILHSADK